jgi:hypothetical protein
MKMNHLPAPKKQTQNKANSNPIRQACVVCEGVAGLIKACPELAEALSAAEGAVEWANFFKGQNRLPKNPATPLFSHDSIIACLKWGFRLYYQGASGTPKKGFVREAVK